MPGFRMPSLEWLEKVNSRVIILSVLVVGIGFLAGIILNVVGRGEAAELPWTDPVIWSSALMLAWLVAAAIFNAVYRPARRGRKVAYLTVVSFVFLVVACRCSCWSTPRRQTEPRPREHRAQAPWRNAAQSILIWPPTAIGGGRP